MNEGQTAREKEGQLTPPQHTEYFAFLHHFWERVVTKLASAMRGPSSRLVLVCTSAGGLMLTTFGSQLLIVSSTQKPFGERKHDETETIHSWGAKLIHVPCHNSSHPNTAAKLLGTQTHGILTRGGRLNVIDG